MNEILLSLDLSVDYAGKPGVVKNATLNIRYGEIVGLIGQSGSGKSTLAMAILCLLNLKAATARGYVRFKNHELMSCSESTLRSLRGREIGLVLQSPMTALNPALTIGTQLKEAWRCHNRDLTDWKRRVLETLESVNLPAEESFLAKLPRQLSVGLAQRVLIAMAILHRPALLIADEPTSALDVITQAEILDLFERLSRDLRMSVLFISHDLLSVARLCERVAIMHEGRIVEVAATDDIFENPRDPYTQRLIAALSRSAPITTAR